MKFFFRFNYNYSWYAATQLLLLLYFFFSSTRKIYAEWMDIQIDVNPLLV